ncbi:C-X-C chemokine receptor type 5, partial [Megalops cyprinoides]|uniref:C-X-C chemokine receptor type 5 n=1 Tax=Megalops cyprinoides TaxID=118141 RepID=UPI0018652601
LACDDRAELLSFHTFYQPLVFSLVLLVGMMGNGLLLAVLMKRQGRLRVTEIYLFHLALADLLLLLTFPFMVAQVSVGWIFGAFLCKIVGLLNRLNFFCGNLLLACISFERYLAIVHAVRSLRGRRPQSVHLTCAAVWLLCLGASTPFVPFLSVGEHAADPALSSCHFHGHGIHDSNLELANRFLIHALCFFLPLTVMSYCYSAVVFTLCRSRHRGLEKRGAIRLALQVTVAFCLCWLPYNLTLLVDTLIMTGVLSPQGCEGLTRVKMVLVVTESIGYAHCCLIPLLYAFRGVHFRKDLQVLLPSSCCGYLDLRTLGAESTSRVSFSEAAISTSSKIM